MELGMYLRHIDLWDSIPHPVQGRIECIVCGDYGCPGVLPSTVSLLDFNRKMTDRSIKLHYISPKVSQSGIEAEAARIKELLAHGIGVSLNDWGLLYRIRPWIKQHSDVYIGRLLTKSLKDWAWSHIFLAPEEEGVKQYFMQNNFCHRRKIEYFKEWGIKGVEVNAYPEARHCYERIQEYGFKVMAYVDNVILAVSRACPVTRFDIGAGVQECSERCRDTFTLVPANEKQQAVYPEIKLSGNVIYMDNDAKNYKWSGCDKTVYLLETYLRSGLTDG